MWEHQLTVYFTVDSRVFHMISIMWSNECFSLVLRPRGRRETFFLRAAWVRGYECLRWWVQCCVTLQNCGIQWRDYRPCVARERKAENSLHKPCSQAPTHPLQYRGHEKLCWSHGTRLQCRMNTNSQFSFSSGAPHAHNAGGQVLPYI